ncbi:MAG: endolytic transglycosylase MltG [Methylococcales bacterium]|nr:endolytic transglycosylase MltG [Methylococcales bacterium]MDP3840396.1 endolytic transglycosylase MltG [Methylococcales bacterium]
MLKKLLLVFLILLSFASGWLVSGYQNALKAPAVIGQPVTIDIAKGDSFRQVLHKLRDQHLFIKPLWFKVIAVRKQAVQKIKTGEYELPTGATIPDILTLLVSGKSKQYTITFPEGRNFKEMRQIIEKNAQLEHTLQGMSNEELMTKLGASEKHPEGLFFPDTYYFDKRTTDVALLKRAYDKMQLVLQQEWFNKAEHLPFNTPYEALILASIVEKETAAKTERAQIAGVFSRRLTQGMMLQTDPTVIYGMGDSYQGNIRSQDLHTETPYNTYKIKGLPPTPIAMAGREAIHAALHPDQSNNSVYFVSRGDGTHVFSTTLDEHNQAVNKFQRQKQ